MDFVNRRMYNETRSQFGDEPETFELIYKDGRATVKDSFSDIEGLELPEAQLAEMEGMFEQIFDQIAGGADSPSGRLWTRNLRRSGALRGCFSGSKGYSDDGVTYNLARSVPFRRTRCGFCL